MVWFINLWVLVICWFVIYCSFVVRIIVCGVLGWLLFYLMVFGVLFVVCREILRVFSVSFVCYFNCVLLVRIGDCVLVLKLVCSLLGDFGNLGVRFVWFV